MDIVRLVDRAGIDSLIDGQRFENALIVGPAVIAPLENVTVSNSSFDAPPEALFIEIAPGRRVVGVIGIRNTTFNRCEFRNVGIIAPPEAAALLRESLNAANRANQDAPPQEPSSPPAEEQSGQEEAPGPVSAGQPSS